MLSLRTLVIKHPCEIFVFRTIMVAKPKRHATQWGFIESKAPPGGPPATYVQKDRKAVLCELVALLTCCCTTRLTYRMVKVLYIRQHAHGWPAPWSDRVALGHKAWASIGLQTRGNTVGKPWGMCHHLSCARAVILHRCCIC